MARTDNEVRSTLSVLDRLIDQDPRTTNEASLSRSASLRDLKQAVRRDLEWLLNTRCHLTAEEGELPEARRSVAFYGVPDFTGLGASSSVEQRRLTGLLAEAIRIFEPRFMNVKVSMKSPDVLDRQLRFRIEAHLDVDPVPEPITFDTVLQFGGDFAVVEE
ncbi:MAG TPA: type VI secretion system baseplate subunit TssE [Pyrinomonadaceae bacterium]|nr:type VI secretion system baseplate subunit TssE [Pyrinomonadaceae bacterium]